MSLVCLVPGLQKGNMASNDDDKDGTDTSYLCVFLIGFTFSRLRLRTKLENVAATSKRQFLHLSS